MELLSRVYYLIPNFLSSDGIFKFVIARVSTVGTTSLDFAAVNSYKGWCWLVGSNCLKNFHDITVALISYYALIFYELYK